MADKDFRVKNGIYVGANAYIEGNITSVELVQMNVASPAIVSGAGQLAWNVDESTIDIGMNANTTLQLGQEQYYYVKNQTGTLIPDGTVVRADGAIGSSGRIKIAPALADGTYPSKYIIGVTSEDIADGEDGFVTSFGKIRQVDTSMFSEGDILYASTTVAGGLANTVPVAPNNIVTVAIVINKHASNGTLFVRPTYGSTLFEDESVHLDAISDGQALVYIAANARFENKTVSGTSSDAFKTISVAGQSNVVAASSTDVLTLVAGSSMSITTNAAASSITIDSVGVTTRSTTAPATSGTLTINGDTTDIFVAEGLTDAITFAQPSGTPINGQKLIIRIEDDGTARAITWTTSAGAFRAIGLTLITTTVINKTTYVGCVYNSTDSFWDVIAIATQT